MIGVRAEARARRSLILAVLIAAVCAAEGTVPAWDRRLVVDQFGYRPRDAKICVLVDPLRGYDAGGPAFAPGAVCEVRRWSDHALVHSGPLRSWHGGTVDAASGDRGWWYDFSTLVEPGDYYVCDPAQGLRSDRLRIAPDVYLPVLRAACRMFYYNRANAAKAVPAADPRWCDAAGHLGPGQDGEARAIWAPGDASLARDCRGGWYDAGDQNKYVTFMSEAVHSLLATWRRRPELWRSLDLGLPESGNAIPDLVDEILVGLRFVMRMQDADGGVFIKVGCRDHRDPSPPSADRRPRFYGPKATSSTIAAAGMLAHAAWALADIPALAAERADMQSRAVRAWTWYQARLDRRDIDADIQAIKSGDADRSLGEQDGEAVVAAIYLFAATGEASYHAWVRDHHRSLQPWLDQRWGMWRNCEGTAISDYLTLPGADPGLVAEICAKRRAEVATVDIYQDGEQALGLFRAANPVMTWGSNRTLCDIGQTVLEVAAVEPGRSAALRERALGIVHYLHGVNPQALVYLSNMQAYGATRSADRIFHTWFAPGTRWGDPSAGPGPAPGYLAGGPNPKPGADIPIPGSRQLVHQQPPQKAWSDEPRAFGIWAITEPAIYYQAAYIELLAEFSGP